MSNKKNKKQKQRKRSPKNRTVSRQTVSLLEKRLHRAISFHQSGKLTDAEKIYKTILNKYPEHPDALHLMGLISYQKGKHDDALDLIRAAIHAFPENPVFHTNLGVVLQSTGKAEEALSAYGKALEIRPDYAEAHFQMGNIRLYQKKYEEALSFFQKALEIKPDYADAYNNMGNTWKDMGRKDKAAQCYQKVLELKPHAPEAHNNMGNILKDQGELDKAVSCYREALKIDPDYPQAYYNLGFAYKEKGDLDNAVENYKKALELKPDYDKSCSSLVHQLQHLCEWQALDNAARKLDRFTKESLEKGQRPAETPFENITRHDDAALNDRVARAWSDYIENSVRNKNLSFTFQRIPKEKITLGYLSNDFHNHPTAHLVLSMFGLHDRKKFNVYSYSYGKEDESHYRKRIAEDSDRFRDLRGMGDGEAAKIIYEDGVDILIDLKGHTTDNRLEICALRPAPVQLTYLGFPGTSGAGFFDYMITDSIVTPEEHRKYYRENLVYMPHCYQVNDHKQEISQREWTRADFDLPEHGFVFCPFNISYKIDPFMFDVWMKILHQVPDSVLWLLHRNETVDKNLKAEAKKRGISARRLIFAAPILKNEHLKRMKLADLALDTRIVNGHTTTSDALWAGVPVIALEGKHFASRVSSSILTTMGLPELITKSPEEYGALALRLARNPGELEGFRKTIAENRRTRPLYDTPAFVKNLEKVYEKMREIWLAGEKPCEIRLDKTGTVITFAKEKTGEKTSPNLNREFQKALAFHQKEELNKAEVIYRNILRQDPEHSQAMHLLGVIAYQVKRHDMAEKLIRKAIRLNPKESGYYSNLGLVLQAQARYHEAVSCFRKAAELSPGFAEAYNNMGNVFQDQGFFEKAVSCYQKALERKPGYAEAHNHLGLSCQAQGKYDDARTCYKKAIEAKPDFADAYYNMATVLHLQGRLDDAVEYCEKTLAIKPDHAKTYNIHIFQLQQICDWKRLEKLTADMERLTESALKKGEISPEQPLTCVTRCDDPALNFAVAKSWADDIKKRVSNANLNFSFDKKEKSRLRIGYLSGDFQNHATAHLMLSLFGLHNRDAFEIYSYSYGKDDNSRYRKKIMEDSDRFTDILHLNHAEAAKRIYEDNVDILIDLKGHTKDNRLEIC
ncbi:MAG: tetratricopeptide repeat protein, partial [Desulfococcaceae bacterium]|nr:tetratricopeptide repeat protein [Desulfococcaceae bacterium]